MQCEFPKGQDFALYASDLNASNGVMDNFFGIAPLPAEVVAMLLPHGVDLCDQALTDAAHHPVFFFFTHNKFGEPPEPAEIDYREMLVGIPFVRPTCGSAHYGGSFTYMPRLYINQDAPREWGNKQFGYEKLAAEIKSGPCGRFDVRTPIDGCRVALAEPLATGRRVHPGEISGVQALAEIFHLPLLTQADRREDPDAFTKSSDAFLVSWIRYEFEHPQARATPIDLSITIDHLFTPLAFPRGTLHVPSILDNALGAFRIEVRQHVFGQVALEDFKGVSV